MSHWMSSLCEVCAVMHQVSSLCEVCAFIHQMSSLCGDCCLHVKTGVSMWDLCHDPSNVFSVGSLCCNPPNVFFMWILCHDTSNVFFMWSLCHFSSTVLFIWLSQNKTIYDFPVLARMLHSFIHLIQLELKTIFLKKKKGLYFPCELSYCLHNCNIYFSQERIVSIALFQDSLLVSVPFLTLSIFTLIWGKCLDIGRRRKFITTTTARKMSMLLGE